MWDLIFTICVGLGAAAAWKAYANRNGDRMPPGIEEGTPPSEWPESQRRKNLDYQITRSWRAYFAGGLTAFAFGVGGTALSAWNEWPTVDAPSRAELIDTLVSDPATTYDRTEAICVVDFVESLGLDLVATNRDQFLRDLATATGSMETAELERFDDCLDLESRADRGDRLEAVSDSELREFVITFILADPGAAMGRATAECILDLLEERGVVRDVISAEAEMPPTAEAAMLEAVIACS